MRVTVLAAMFVVSIGAPAAVAQPPADPQDRCATLPTLWPEQRITFRAARPIGADGCAYDGLVIPLAGKMSLAVEHLTLGELDFGRLYARELPPALRLRADGVRTVVKTDQPVVNYIANFNVVPFALSAAWHWRVADKVFRLDELSLSGAAIGLVRLSGELARVDPARIAAVGPRGDADIAVMSARLRLENHGFFEHYVVPPAAGALLQGAPDPEAKVEELKREAVAGMRAWFAGTGTAPATVDTLAAFVDSLPRPRGTLDVSIDLPRPFGMAELAAVHQGKAHLMDFFPTGAVKATHAP